MIKSVLFDIDGVLIDSFEANLKFYQNLMTKVGYKPPTRKEFLSLFHANMYDVIKTLTKSSDENEIQKIWKLGKSRDIPYPMELIKTPDGLEQTVIKLSKDYTLGLVTNRVRDGIYEIPVLAKLQHYFQVVVTYEDTANHKPHPEPLLRASKELNMRPHETVYIGDVENDMIAGKAAGMKTILYAEHPLKSAYLTTFSFENLPKLISSLWIQKLQ